jgi:hypothetical protein
MSICRFCFLLAVFSIAASPGGRGSGITDTSSNRPLADVAATGVRAGKTQWKVEGSPAFDACCLINTLTGDPYYLKYYQADFDRWWPKLSADCRTALARLRSSKEKRGEIISAQLTLYFSAVDVFGLADILAALRAPKKRGKRCNTRPIIRRIAGRSSMRSATI